MPRQHLRWIPWVAVWAGSTAVYQFLMRAGDAGWLAARLSIVAMVLTGVGCLVIIWLNAARRRRRVRAAECPTCGYDLQATPGRCPDRGTAAAEVA